jgi:antitoxin component YwqK of YwqJK toxin-antitoxin module
MEIEIKKYYHKNGNIMSELSYLDGRPYGMNRQWYDNGNVEGQYYYNHFGMNGLYQWWYNGNLRSIISKHKNGRQHGLCIKIKYY